MVDTVFSSLGDIKVGKYIIIDGSPCRVMSIDKSKPGKHGAAKINVVAMGLFDGIKRTLAKSSDADVEVPVIERKRSQVVSVSGNSAQLMDLESYETFEVSVPEDLKSQMEVGKEIQYMETMGRKILLHLSGGD